MSKHSEALKHFKALKKYCEEYGENACECCIFNTGYPINRKSYEYFWGLVAGLADHRKFDIILDRAKKRMEEEEVNERIKAYKELEETRNICRAYADEIRRKLVDKK